MSALDTSMLSAMRSAIAELLPDTCSIISVTLTPDGMGGQIETYGTATANCRLDVVTDKAYSQTQVGAGLKNFISTILSVPYDTTITEDNRVIHGGITYAVVAPVNSDQSWIAVKRVQLERY